MDTSQSLQASVSRAVTEAIEAADETTAGISKATGISRMTLTRRLSGGSAFTVAELHLIAVALGKDPVDFLRAA